MKRSRYYYTKTEAAEYLGVDKWVLDYLRALELGPAYVLIGKKIRYEKGVVDEWGMGNLLWIR